MDELKYFIVQVKLEMETDLCDKAGNPKVKKWKETWCVRANSTKHADEIVREEYNGAVETWKIASIKETDYIGTLNC
jgi:hypothetical protein